MGDVGLLGFWGKRTGVGRWGRWCEVLDNARVTVDDGRMHIARILTPIVLWKGRGGFLSNAQK